MADGITHAKFAAGAAIVVTGAATVAAVTMHPVASGLIVGAWGAFVAGPDLDHHVYTVDEQRIWRYDRTLGRLWHWYWWPYEKLMPHRGRSHTIPAGTFDRFVLLFWPLLLLSAWFTPTWWLVLWWPLVLCGQCMVDAVHLWLDGMI